MKTAKYGKKLVFSKETVTALDSDKMDAQRGGTSIVRWTEFNTCEPTCPPSQPIDCPFTSGPECF